MRTAALLLLLVVSSRAEELEVRWQLVDNSGQAEFETKRGVVRFARERGGGMDVLRADLPRAPRAGSEFLLKARFRAERVGNGWFKVFFYDANGQSLGQGRDVKSLRGTYDWKEIALDQKAPEGTVSATVMVLLVQPGALWIDDLRIETRESEPEERKPLDKKLARWLDRNATEVRTLDLEGDLRDLAPLAKRLRGVRVVQLGENTHGDGAAFRAKVRLIRWLHETQGFDVLAFESGMYECEAASRMLKPGADPKAVMEASIFPIWHTEQVAPLFAYLVEQSGTRRPMGLTGFDLRVSGGAADGLRDEARAALRSIGEEGAGPDDGFAPPLLAAFGTHREALAKELGARRFAFLERCLRLRVARDEFEKREGRERTNVRDEWMGRNLVWLAKERYPDAKIVCWAATAHQAHGLDGVRNGGEPMYDDVKMAGVWAKEGLGRELYTIGFVAHGGWAGLWHRPNFRVPRPAEGSVEDLLFRYGKPMVFVPLDGAPFDWPAKMAPMSYGRGIEAEWPKVLDAVIYIEEMEPARALR